MKLDLPQVIEQVGGGRNRVTPRHLQSYDWSEMIGKTLKSNLFPTFWGKFVYYNELKGRCYFEILPNPEWPKYNKCAGQIEYIPDHHVVYMKFEEEY